MEKTVYAQGTKAGAGTFVKGFLSPFAAFKVLKKHKGLVKYFIIPFILNIIILSAIFYFSYTGVYGYVTSLLSGNAWYITVIRFILMPGLFIILGTGIILVYSITGCIITAPFNDILSQKVERAITGDLPDEKFRLLQLIRDITRTCMNVLKLLSIVLIINLALMFLNFIPFLGSLLYTALSFMTASFFIGFQFFDFPLERRRLPFSRKLSVLWRYKFPVIGLGAAFFTISYVPIIGFLGLNLATIGATTLFIEHIMHDFPKETVLPGDGT